MENQETKSHSEDNKKETPNQIPKIIYTSEYWNKNLKWTKQNL